jgi:ATP-dependent phosphoenolpyruvate carboxykinase
VTCDAARAVNAQRPERAVLARERGAAPALLDAFGSVAPHTGKHGGRRPDERFAVAEREMQDRAYADARMTPPASRGVACVLSCPHCHACRPVPDAFSNEHT